MPMVLNTLIRKGSSRDHDVDAKPVRHLSRADFRTGRVLEQAQEQLGHLRRDLPLIEVAAGMRPCILTESVP